MNNLGRSYVLISFIVVFMAMGIINSLAYSEELSLSFKEIDSLFQNIKIAEAYKPIGLHNPLLPQRFGADPYALAYEKVYVYSTNDAIIGYLRQIG